MVFIKDGEWGKMREGRFLFVGGYGGGLCGKGIIFFFISMQLLSPEGGFKRKLAIVK